MESTNRIRSQFLQAWGAYPAVIGDGFGARVQSTQKDAIDLLLDGGLRATLEGPGRWPLCSKKGHIWRENLLIHELGQILRSGDWIWLKTKTSQLATWTSDHIEAIELVAPNWHFDFRQIETNSHVRRFSFFTEDVRQFFLEARFFQAETPHLVCCPGMEPHLQPFSTEWRWGARTQELFLPTSPELHLKKLLCQGLGPLFEIKKVFRNEEISEVHQPEFLMLEWYRTFTDLDAIEMDIQKLLGFLRERGWGKALADLRLERKSVHQLFRECLDFELHPQSDLQALLPLAARHYPGEDFNSEDFDDLFHRLWVDFIDPELVRFPALIVYDYPPSQAALARLTKEGWADRRELYLSGIEIANGYNELIDPREQRQRFLQDFERRRNLSRVAVPIDEEFLHLLERGMPPSAGIAMGLERLFMSLEGIHDIREILPFPHKEGVAD